MTWEPSRIPIVLHPLPGEALDSYLGAYARRLRSIERQFLAHLGLADTSAARMTVRLTDRELEALTAGLGLAPQQLRAMTLEPHDGLAVALSATRRRVIRAPGWRFEGSRTRYCPRCLAENGGRGPVRWRFPWSFACPEHAVMLLDFCPACGRYPAPWTVRGQGPQHAGSCTRGSVKAPCGADLMAAAALALPEDGPVMSAHRHVAGLLAADATARAAALAEVRELYALAWRAVRGTHTAMDSAPALVRAVLAECGGGLPKINPTDVGADAVNAAVGTALAVAANRAGDREGEAVFDWIVRADLTLVNERLGIGVVAARWKLAGQPTLSRVLGRLDGKANLHTRLRYATATAHPRWPECTDEQIRARAAQIPGMLWPSWAMRLLPRPTGGQDEADPRSGLFRRGCAGFLLLPGGPPQLNFERALPLLGGGFAGRHGRGGVDGPRDAVERRIYECADVTPLAATLAELAYAIDAHGAPIDYARRRALFSWANVQLDPVRYERLCIQLGWYRTGPREALLTWYLLMLLTGEHHRPPPRAHAAFQHECKRLRFTAPRAVRSFLQCEGERLLVENGIAEPVCWEPPASWATSAAIPGVEPDQMDADGFARLIRESGSVADAAATLGWTHEHVRLYCEITGLGLDPLSANGKPLAPQREWVLAAENLRELYERRLLPLKAITEMAGCNSVTVRRLLEIDGVAERGRFRKPLPEGGIDREWVEREYLQHRRPMSALAAELKVGEYYLTKLAGEWGIPSRGVGRHYSGIGHLRLNMQPSAALEAVARGSTGLDRLAFLAQLPGHRTFTAAAQAIYAGRRDMLAQRLRKLEKDVGFEIIDRWVTPLAPTERGAALLAEAAVVLKAAGPRWAGLADAPAASGGGSSRVRAEREANGSCPADCSEHDGHIYTLCFGAASMVQARDYLPGDPARDYPITHYVGWSGQRPSRRIRTHACLANRFVAQIQPGDSTLECAIKLHGRCPVCAASLWYYAESPTYPGWTPEQVPEVLVWPREPGRALRTRPRPGRRHRRVAAGLDGAGDDGAADD